MELTEETFKNMEKNNEIFKPIMGYEGKYEISNMGRVKSLKRKQKTKSNGFAIRKGKIIKTSSTGKGYLQIKLSMDGRERSFSVARLVAIHFIGLPETGRQVNHIDSDRKNNNINNLEWVKQQQNSDHRMAYGKVIRGEDVKQSKLKEEDIVKIRKLLKNHTVREIASKFKVSHPTIVYISQKKIWKHVKNNK